MSKISRTLTAKWLETKELVFQRDKKCLICEHSPKYWTPGEKVPTGHFNCHHVEHSSNGGADKAFNLVTVCTKCHRKLHENGFSAYHRRKSEAKLKEAVKRLDNGVIYE